MTARENQTADVVAASHTPSVAASPAQLLERISTATCCYHGFSSEAERQGHINSIVATLWELRHAK